MKIQERKVTASVGLNRVQQSQTNLVQKNIADSFVRASQLSSHYTVSFMGHPVHIFDGGNHANDMLHFANAISKDMDNVLHPVRTNSKEPSIKQIDSILQQLNSCRIPKEDYIAIPAGFFIPLGSVKSGIKAVLGRQVNLVPGNIRENKSVIMEMLKKLKDNPEKYRKEISWLDPNEQGIIYVYDLIKKIDKLSKDGSKIYIPACHPEHQTLKWLSGAENRKPELYHYIATKNDVNGAVKAMREKIKSNNWYEMNLLSLSNANIVNLENKYGEDFLYSAYDSTVNTKARGVYNLSPIRNSEKVVGFSFSDESSNEYPIEEFKEIDNLKYLLLFVGKNIEDVRASKDETKELLQSSFPKSSLKSKLFKVSDVFSKKQIADEKINLKGEYTDYSRKYFFNTNKTGSVIFPNCDCEGSGKPSVKSMWGCCFATFNAIKNDIRKSEPYKVRPGIILSDKNSQKYKISLEEAKKAEVQENYVKAENEYNKLLNNLCRDVKNIQDDYLKKPVSSLLVKLLVNMFLPYSKKPDDNKFLSELTVYETISDISQIFTKLNDLCERKGETEDAARICRDAAYHIKKQDRIGRKIIEKRASGNINLGDVLC